VTDYAKAAWVGSPNYTPARAGHNPNWTPQDPNTWIVLHTMVGTEAAARARFENPAQQASSHYGVTLAGKVYQYVRESDAAWTNGTMAGVGSNLDSVTIEHEDGGAYNGPRTPALYEASAQLVADIARRRHIPLVHRGVGGGVLGHRECSGAQTACPDSLDLARIIARAIQINTPAPAPPPSPPVDTRPEWLRNLVTAAQTAQLYVPVPLWDMTTGAAKGTVQVGTLVTAFTTHVGGTAYRVTQYSKDHNEGLGIPESAITVASQPPTSPAPAPIPTPQPAPVPAPQPTPPTPAQPAQPPRPPADVWPWLQSLLDSLRKLFGGK
jgi:hypothetical protein